MATLVRGVGRGSRGHGEAVAARDEGQYPNWFVQYAQGYFERHLSRYAGQPGLRFLQIGAYTGDATAWLLDHVLTGPDSILVDVDTWSGSDEEGHAQMDFSEVERIYDSRTARMRSAGRLIKHKGTSKSFFDLRPGGPYDFIYIDGDHTAYGVLNDATRSYPLLRVGGILAFDDYEWQSGKGRLFDPAPAIDAIAELYSNRLTRLEGGREVWFEKTGAPEDALYEGPEGRPTRWWQLLRAERHRIRPTGWPRLRRAARLEISAREVRRL